MLDQQVKTTFEQAEEIYNNAQQELYKPEEDVVHYMVCHGAFKATYKYLKGYLLNHKVEVADKAPLETLIGQCRKIDPKFLALNLEKFYNATEEEDVWMDIGTAQEFLQMAADTRTLIVE